MYEKPKVMVEDFHTEVEVVPETSSVIAACITGACIIIAGRGC